VGWGGGVSDNAQKEDRIKVVLGGTEGVQEGALLKPLGSLGGGVNNNAQKEDRIEVVLGGPEGAQEGALLKPLGSLDGSQGV
jgi:hypothetical protein